MQSPRPVSPWRNHKLHLNHHTLQQQLLQVDCNYISRSPCLVTEHWCTNSNQLNKLIELIPYLVIRVYTYLWLYPYCPCLHETHMRGAALMIHLSTISKLIDYHFFSPITPSILILLLLSSQCSNSMLKGAHLRTVQAMYRQSPLMQPSPHGDKNHFTQFKSIYVHTLRRLHLRNNTLTDTTLKEAPLSIPC